MKDLSNHELRLFHEIETAMDLGLSMSIEYDGLTRLVEPHAVGVTKAGRPCLRVYQVHGGSLSGEHQGWKMMTMEKIFTFPKIIDIRTDGPREGYRRGDLGMKTIFKEL